MHTAAPAGSNLERVRRYALHGIDEKSTAKFGGMCLLARRMVERGVRFVQLISTDWDGHSECDKNHVDNARKIDRPIAGLIADLKQRGLLESTLLVWVGEFGRTPVMQGKEGRDHHPYGFTAWIAGGRVRGGLAVGATDEFGFRAVTDRVHVNDLHGAMLSLLGMYHRKVTYFFQGRDFRVTDVGGDFDLARLSIGCTVCEAKKELTPKPRSSRGYEAVYRKNAWRWNYLCPSSLPGSPS